MSKHYLGVDIGSISTKAIVMDENNNIILDKYIWTQANPILATKTIINDLKKEAEDKGIVDELNIVGVGTTGSARKLVGSMLDSQVVKNEITAHAIGTLSIYPDVRTILEIGGQDSKIIIIQDGVVVDYAMNTLCAAGTGAFLSSQAQRLGVKIEDLGDISLKSNNPSKIAAKCTVFAESDLVHKAQIGHTKEDIIAGLCKAVVSNYLNNVGKGKNIYDKVVFQGGVSKNEGVTRYFKEALQKEVYVDKNSHLMGALGVAILARKSDQEKKFNFDISEQDFITKGSECSGCSNNCEIIKVYKNGNIIDRWGNRCENSKT
ncbi:MAG: acyl-CoA dehydratase activase [Clostridia bacterium]|nr:acyl-CoA dehydratase activase [Clostridia bacterium]